MSHPTLSATKLVTPRRAVAGAVVAVGLLAAACSSGASTSSGTHTSSTSSAAQPAATSPAMPSVVHTVSNPTLGTILVNSSGMTLYRFTHDMNGQSACSGMCAQAWPPLTVPAGAHVSVTGVGGTFATMMRSDGSTQVTYNGSPLYTYSGDKAPGDTSGQGVGGIWFAAMASAGSSTGSGSSGGSSGGSHAPVGTQPAPSGGGSGGSGY